MHAGEIPVSEWQAVPARRLRHAPDFPPERVWEAIERHRRCLRGAGPGAVRKRDGPNRVTLVELDDGRWVCVKESGWRGAAHRWKDLLRPPPALREWRAAPRLAQLGIPVAAPLALVSAPLATRGSSGFLILEALAAHRRLDEFVAHRFAAGRDREQRRSLVLETADALRRLHDAGVDHGDTKAANLLVRETPAGWSLVWIDLAEARFGRAVPRGRRTLSLAQLNASVPLVVTVTDRLRFLRRYARGLASFEPLARPWREILRTTRTRKCIWDRKPEAAAGSL